MSKRAVGGSDLVLHLARSRTKSGGVDRRIVASIIGGVVLVLAALFRVLAGSQSAQSLEVDFVIALVVLGAVVLYAVLQFRNTSVYVKGGRIGITNALGIGRDVAVSEVIRLSKASEDPAYRGGKPVNVLVIVTSNPRHVLRLRGADQLDNGGADRLASAINVPLDGSWQ